MTDEKEFNMVRKLLALVLLTAVTQATMADNGIYFGASIANADTDFESTIAGLQTGTQFGSDSGFKLILGARPLDWLAIEANYADLGSSGALFDNIACVTVVGTDCPLSAGGDSTALSASVIGILPLPLFDLYARGGVARWDLDERFVVSSVPGNSVTTSSDNGFDPVYGIGAQFKLGSFAVRAEVERIDVGKNATDVVSLGITYTLL